MAGTVRIQVLADADQARRELASTDKAVGGIGKGFGKLGTVAKAGFAAAAVGAAALGTKVVGFVNESVDAASALEQSTGAVEAVFGKQAAGIKKAAEGAAQSFGLSTNKYQELATVLGAGLKNQGIKDFAGETQKVIGLGADLAAQFGGSTKEAVESVASLMRGEADPIEKYGVTIKETAIAAELAAEGQDKLKGAALDQAKAQARLSLLFKQTKDAQGTFVREGDTLATMQQKNAEATENLKAKLGTVLLPVMVALQQVLANKVLPVVEQVFGWIEQNAPGAISAVKGFLTGLQGDGAATQYLEYVKTTFSTILPVVQQLVGAVVAAWPAISSALSSVFSALQAVMTVVGQLWELFGPTIIAQVTNVFTTVAGIIGGAMQVIAGIFQTISAVMQGDWAGAWQGIQSIVTGQTQILTSVITGVLTAIDNLTGGALTRVKTFWVNTFTSVRSFVAGAIEGVRSTVAAKVDAVQSKIGTVLAAIKSVWSSAWSWLKSTVSTAWSAIVSTVTSKVADVQAKISGLKSKIIGVFSGAGDWLRSAGRRIIQGLLDGINELIGRVRDKLNALTDMIPDWKGPRERDARLLFDAGKLIMGSLVRGFDAGETGIQSKLASVTRLIEHGLSDVMSPVLTPTIEPSVALPGELGSLAGLGGNVYQIDVTVQAGVGDPVAIGREVSNVLDAYLGAGGRRKAA